MVPERGERPSLQLLWCAEGSRGRPGPIPPCGRAGRPPGRLHDDPATDAGGVSGSEERMTMDPLEARNLFPITEHYIYMNHAGVAPMSERARAAVLSVAETATEHPLGEEFWNVPLKLRESIGTLINAPAESVSLVRSTAHAISLLAGGLDWKPGDNVVGAR